MTRSWSCDRELAAAYSRWATLKRRLTAGEEDLLERFLEAAGTLEALKADRRSATPFIGGKSRRFSKRSNNLQRREEIPLPPGGFSPLFE